MFKDRARWIIFGLITLFVSLVYFLTTAPTVVFWDVGEFLAAAKNLGVPHPPGTPLYVILAKFFSLLPLPLAEIRYLIYHLPQEQHTLRVTLIPILTGGLTAGILYLMFLDIVAFFRNKVDYDNIWVHISAAFVALLSSFIYTQWFNSIEAETYTPAYFFALLSTYLTLIWLRKREEKGSVRYLLMAAYLVALGSGIHLGALLGLIAVVLFFLIFEWKFFVDDEFWAVLSVALALIALWLNSYHVAELMNAKAALNYVFLHQREVDAILVNPDFLRQEMATISASILKWNVVYLLAVIGMMWVMYKKGKLVFNNLLSQLFVFSAFVSVVAMFLYGSKITLFAALIFGFVALISYYLYMNLHRGWKGVAFLLMLLAVIVEFWLIARASYLHRFPELVRINEGDPYTWVAFMDVLTRKQYGPLGIFPRRIPFVEQLQVFWTYFSWQFASIPYYTRAQAVPIIYAIVALMVLGLFTHFSEDRKSFWLVFLFALTVSLGLILYQNPADVPSLPVNPENATPNPLTGVPRMEVRDREYFYVLGYIMIIFYAGIGLMEVMRILKKYLRIPAIAVAVIGLLFAVPTVGYTFVHNLRFNDRHKNYIAEDFAYNILSSPDKKAVIFTNGDNDTFPVWFAQEVLEYRRDVVVANLSLLNTNWYVRQVKAWGAPMNFTDEEIEKLPLFVPLPKPFERNKQKVNYLLLRDIAIRDMIAASVSYKPDKYIKFLTDKGIVEIPEIYLADDETYLREVVLGRKFSVPIYFSMTSDPQAYASVKPTLVLEGIAWRVTPEIQSMLQQGFWGKVDVERTAYLLHGDMDPVEYIEKYAKQYKIYKEGVFRYRSIFDPSVYKGDPATMRVIRNYVTLFMILGDAYRIRGEYEKSNREYLAARMFLDVYESYKPQDRVSLNQKLLIDLNMADNYMDMGKVDEALKILKPYEGLGNPLVNQKLSRAYQMLGDTAKASNLIGGF